MVTVNKRETSLKDWREGKLENGEDGIYNMIANDKNIIFHQKYQLQKKILRKSWFKRLRDEIEKVEEEEQSARGKKAFLLKKQAY